jgi:hypothetical protein
MSPKEAYLEEVHTELKRIASMTTSI